MVFARSLTLLSLFYISHVDAEFSTYFVDSRIVGGKNATEGAFPYQVSLRQHGHHFCGGSIISARYILTAAHCLHGQNSENIKVVVGTNHLNDSGDTYQAEKLIAHASYYPLIVQNDIGLIRVGESIRFGEKVQAVQLPDSQTTYVSAGDDVILTGWGRTSYPGNLSQTLKYINLTAIDNYRCQWEHLPGIVTWGNVCTFTKDGEGACHGDSGGPLVQNNTLVGVVSWGRPCAVGKPDVFTRVSYFMDWIAQNTIE